MKSHSLGCLLRWASATWVLTIAIFSLYLVWLGYSESLGEAVELYLVVGLLAAGMSLVAVWLLARPYGALALIATPLAGFLLGYTWGLLTYGSGAEDGTVWRGFGGAIVGGITALTAWSLQLVAHRLLSRDTCRTPSPVE